MELTREQLEIRAAAAAAALTLQCPDIKDKEPIPCKDSTELWEFVKTYEHYFDYVMSKLEKHV